MREVAFIKQNKEKWLEFEHILLSGSSHDPDSTAHLYVQLVNDLSFAQTYYPKSKTTIYLNHLASQVYQKIYRTKREDHGRLKHFFNTEVPLIMYQYRKTVWFTFVLFFAVILIGVISAKYDETFVRLIMGDGYVNMTLENIKKGNPTAVYASGSNWGSFIAITINNLTVGAKCYMYGIFLGIGTFMVFLYNMITLGSFQYFFYEQGHFWESVRAIWIHGSMEIFAIVIESAAGFILGASILFPKTYSRLASFKIGFKNSIKIYLSTWPFTIAAGFLEGFITRYSISLPHWLSVFVILSTLAAISYYYLVYPKIVQNRADATK